MMIPTTLKVRNGYRLYIISNFGGYREVELMGENLEELIDKYWKDYHVQKRMSDFKLLIEPVVFTKYKDTFVKLELLLEPDDTFYSYYRSLFYSYSKHRAKAEVELTKLVEEELAEKRRNKKHRLTFVGTMEEFKNLDYLIQHGSNSLPKKVD